jgi:hypothetical protein
MNQTGNGLGDGSYASPPYGAPPPLPGAGPGTGPGQGKRGLLGLGFAVVGIVAFAGTILVSYRGGDRISGDGPPLLTADPSPSKSRPEQPGGMDVPHQDKLVYERLHERGNRPNIERLLPPPEAPLPRPVVTPQMPALPPMPAEPVIGQLPPPPPGSTSTVPRDSLEPTPAPVIAAVPSTFAPSAAPKPNAASTKTTATQTPAKPQAAAASQTAALPPPVAPKPTSSVTVKPTPASVASPPSVTSKPLPQPPPSQAATTSSTAAQPTKPTSTTITGGSGNWRIQLASVRSETEAAAEWKRIVGRHPDVLNGLSFQVSKVDLAEKGTFYRVQGNGADETRAKSICAQLRAQNVGCVVVRP